MRLAPWSKLSLCVALSFVVSGCVAVRWSTSTHRDYDYWGEIKLGETRQVDGNTIIPVLHNPSDGELWMDASQTIWDVPVSVEENDIFFYMRTCLASASSTTIPKPAIRLPALAPGTYKISYKGPENNIHTLGEITIPE